MKSIKSRTIVLFILLSLFLNNLYGSESSFSYYFDKTNSLKIEDLKNLKFKDIPLKHSSDVSYHTVWYKVKLENKTNKIENLFLHNNFAFMSKHIDIYEVSKNKVLNHQSYNLFYKDIGSKLIGKNIVYPITLNTNSGKIIYIKNQALVHQVIDIAIFNTQRDSDLALSNQNFYSNIIIVILFTLGFYNFMLFFFTKRKEFAFYSFYMINCAFGLFYMYGSVFQNLHIYGEDAYLFNLTAIGVTFFLSLFIKYIFDIDKQNPKVNMILNSIIILALIHFIIAIFIDLYLVIKYLHFLFLYSYIVVLYIGISFYKQDHPLSKIFLTAYTIYTIGFTFTLLVFTGQIEFNSLYFHGSGIALVFEGFIFAYMLSYRLKLLEEENLNQKHMLVLKNKKEQLGEVIGNIAHQWRQPLNRISLNSAVITEAIKDDAIDTHIIDVKLKSIDKNIHYMSDTIEDFVDFYNPNKEKDLFNVDEIINKALNLLNNRINNIEININTNKDLEIYGISNEYLQVLLIILNNTLDNFMIKDIQNQIIDINLFQDQDSIRLTICDNGGGIKKEHIYKIFDPYFTTKFTSEGTGLGLYLARMIIEESLNGELNVSVDNNKTTFTIDVNTKEIH